MRGSETERCCPPDPSANRCSALSRAQAIIVTKTSPVGPLANTLRRYASDVPLFSAELKPVSLSQWEDGELRIRSIGDLVGRRVGHGLGDRGTQIVL